MVPQFQDNFAHMTYEQAMQYWPGLNERVFNAAKEITPAQLRFELDRLNLPFNMEREVDDDTFAIISTVLAGALNEPNIVLTPGDIQCAYFRFAHLIWLYEIVKQGIYEEVLIGDELHYMLKLKQPTRKRYQPQTTFVTPNFVGLFWK
jgi:hypothetical protein